MDSALGRLKAEVVSVLTIFRTVKSQSCSSSDILGVLGCNSLAVVSACSDVENLTSNDRLYSF